MTVELNASASYDKENSPLNYKWVQVLGENITIVNDDTSNPSFIAPEVNKDEKVNFELSISDGSITTKGTIAVDIINKEKDEKRHEVMPKSNTVTSTKGVVNLSYIYNTDIPHP